MAEIVDETDDDETTPKGLRSKLEAALEANRKLQNEVNQHRAKETLAAKGFDLVKPEDLVDVKPDGSDSNPTSILPRVIDPEADAGILMPRLRDDNRLLTAAERARIAAWLARGAPFD